MANNELLKQRIKDSGYTIVRLAHETGILRETLYNRMNGRENSKDYKASEIESLTRVLKLTRDQVDEIFFPEMMN